MGWQSIATRAEDGTVLQTRLSAMSHRPLCVLIHGSGEASYVWHTTARVLAERYAVAIVNLRGHGDSEPSRCGRYELALYVNDLASIIQQLAPERMFVIGHSLGGQIALQLAGRLYKTLSKGLALVDVCPQLETAASRQAALNLKASMRVYASHAEYRAWLLESRPLLSEAVATEIASASLRPCNGGYELKLDPAFVASDRGETIRTPPAEWNGLLRELLCPTLVVRGAMSAMMSLQSARSMMPLLKQGLFNTIPNAGHAVMSDNPGAFTKCIADFLAGIERPSDTQIDRLGII